MFERTLRKDCDFCGLYCLVRNSEKLSSESHNQSPSKMKVCQTLAETESAHYINVNTNKLYRILSLETQ